MRLRQASSSRAKERGKEGCVEDADGRWTRREGRDGKRRMRDPAPEGRRESVCDGGGGGGGGRDRMEEWMEEWMEWWRRRTKCVRGRDR